MLIENRKEYIYNLLDKQSYVKVSELSKEFGLSEVSVRKLLQKMEKEGMLKRSWGGAVSINDPMYESDYKEKRALNQEEKRIICNEAYNQINDGDAVFIDSGTTTMMLAKLISRGNKRDIVVFTNSVSAIRNFRASDDISVFLVGGEFRHNVYSCVGMFAINMIKNVNFDKAFITGTNFTLNSGFSTPNFKEVEIKRAVMESSKNNYIMIDYSKYGKDSMAIFSLPSEVDNIITDWRIEESVKEGFCNMGVNVIVAKKGVC